MPDLNGRGYLAPNKYKKEEKHPDWKGKVTTPDGQEFDIAGWDRNKVDDDGSNYTLVSLSLSVPRPQEPKPDKEPPPKRETMANVEDDLSDDIPF